LKIAIIAAEFNRAITEPMIESAVAEATSRGVEIHITRVPGAYEIPLPASVLFDHDDIDAVVALGFIERGETLHGQVMGHVVHDALLRMSIEHRKGLGIGIIGPGATEAQAQTRKDAYARAAVRAAIGAIETLKMLK
jgi:6,7-dimethyl-8-ribityllumazine synthase